MTDSATQSAKKLLWENLEVVGLLIARQAQRFRTFRLFTHTKQGTVVAGCTSGRNLSDEEVGCFFSPGEKCSLDSQKISAVRATPKNDSAWFRTDDLWV